MILDKKIISLKGSGLIALIMGLVTFCLLSVPATVVYLQSKAEFETDFRSAVELIDNFSGQLMARTVYGLQGLSGVYRQGHFHPTDNEIYDYAKSRDFFSNFNGSLGFGFVRYVPADKYEKFKAAFELSHPETKLHSPQHKGHIPGTDAMVIENIQPIENNRAALGLDVGTEGERRTAAMLAATTGEVAMTRPIQLVQRDGDSDWGFLIFLPVYDHPEIPKTEVDRLAHLVGWTYTPVSATRIFSIAVNLIEKPLKIIVTSEDDEHRPIFVKSLDFEGGIKREMQIPQKIFNHHWKMSASRFISYTDKVVLTPFLILMIALGLGFAVGILVFRFSERIRQQYQTEVEMRKALFEHSPDGILTFDLESMSFTSCNQGAANMLLSTPEEIIGRPLIELAPEIQADGLRSDQQFIAIIKATIRKGFARFEWRLKRSDGKLIPVEVVANLVKQGGKSNLLILWKDLSTIKNLQQELEESLAWTTSVVNSTDYSIIATDMNGIISTFNFGAERMLGYRAIDLVGNQSPAIFHDLSEIVTRSKQLSDEFSTEIFPGFEVFVYKARAKGSDTQEWTYIRKDGSRLPVRLAVTCLYNSEHEQIGYLGIAKDITKEREAQNELRQLQAAINQAAIISSSDTTGKIIEANDRFVEISGYLRDELIGQDHRIVNSGFHGKEFWASFWARVNSGQSWSGQVRNKRKNGEFYWVQSVVTPIFDINKKIVRLMSIRFDITENKRQEIQLMHASKLASLGEMSSGIAHEINNPLAIISGNASKIEKWIQKGAQNLDEMTAAIQMIKQMTVRATGIIKGLRAFSQSDPNEPRSVSSFNKIVEDTMGLIRAKLEAQGIELRLSLFDNIEINCRKSEISQILMSLVQNSIDAVGTQAEKWIEISLIKDGNFATLAVTDSGKGIPKPLAEKLMQPFFTTKPVGQGIGLGLSISLGLAKDHGGDLKYVDHSDHTRFELSIPLKQAIAA